MSTMGTKVTRVQFYYQNALSRIYEGELAVIETIGPEIDLDSEHFDDPEYDNLKPTIQDIFLI